MVSHAPDSILVVDDDSSIRQLIEIMLAGIEHPILKAANGHEALNTLRTTNTKVVLMITDIHMPLMDGISLGHLVQEQWPDVVVLTMSGDYIGPNPFPCLQKPFSKPDLKSWIGKLCPVLR